jgi:hypothetical protein
MRRGDLSIISSSLHFALKTLRIRWDETSEIWNDSVRVNFEETYLAPLEPQVVITLKAINRLAQVLARANEECT